MAASKTNNEEVIICNLCDNPIQKFCNSCQTSLCNDCISRHTEKFNSVPHDIVSFCDREIRLKLPVCQKHPNHRCKVHCMYCNEPVCKKCIFVGPHQGHTAVSYKHRRNKIKSETQEIQCKLFPKYRKEDADISATILKTETKLCKLGEESHQLRQIWQKEVENIFDKIDSQCQSLRIGKLNALKTYQKKIKVLISRINETIERNERLLQTTHFSDLSSYESKLKEFRNFPEMVNIRMPSFYTKLDHGKKLMIKMGDYRVTLKYRHHPTLSTDNPTQKICNSFQTNLCNDCISDHIEQFNSVPHNIVSFCDKEIRLNLPVCQSHPSHRCKVHCMYCNEPVCKKCIFVGPHLGHNAVSYEYKRNKIKSETQEIQCKLFPKYRKEDAEISAAILKTETKLCKLGEESKRLRQIWHKEVENIFDKIDTQCQFLKDGKLNALKKYQKKIKDLIARINETIERNERLLQTTHFFNLISYESKLKEFRNFPEKVNARMPSLNTKLDQGKKLMIKMGDYRVTLKYRHHPTLSALTTQKGKLIDTVRNNGTFLGSLPSLTDLSSLEDLSHTERVIAISPTKYKPLLEIACVGGTHAWIYGVKKTITCIDIHGCVKDRFTSTCQYGPRGISVTRKGELIYSHGDKRIVNIVRKAQAEALAIKLYGDGGYKAVCVANNNLSERLITLPVGWRPGNIFCTRYGDILVHLSGTLIPDTIFQNKIVRYQGQNITQEIQNHRYV